MGMAVLAWPLILVGLIILAFIIAITAAVIFAGRTGRSKWRWALIGFFLVYLPIFWDWVPTVVVHQYYCATEAGFWVYKTVDQWKVENPGMIETLVKNKVPVKVSHEGDQNSWVDTVMLNQRIKKVSKREGPLMLYRWRWEGIWIDSETDEVLARYVDFYTSYKKRQAGNSGWKFWLSSDHCPNYQSHAINFSKTIEQFNGEMQ